MKKLLFTSLILLGVFGLMFSKASVAQSDLLLSPGVWILGTTAVENVTIHVADVIYSEVTKEDISLTIDTEEIDFSIFADNRGELVIRFTPDLENYNPNEDIAEIELSIKDQEYETLLVTIKEPTQNMVQNIAN